MRVDSSVCGWNEDWRDNQDGKALLRAGKELPFSVGFKANVTRCLPCFAADRSYVIRHMDGDGSKVSPKQVLFF